MLWKKEKVEWGIVYLVECVGACVGMLLWIGGLVNVY